MFTLLSSYIFTRGIFIQERYRSRKGVVMKGSQIVRTLMNAWESHNIDELHKRLAEDCIFTGLVPQPINKEEFISIAIAILKAMPDLSLHATDFQEDGDKVRVQTAITGRHIRELR